MNIHQYPHLQDLDLADCCINDAHTSNIDIDILIGSDYYYDFITGEIIRGEGGPVAINSTFWWLVSGPTKENDSYAGVSTTNLIIESPLISQDYTCAIENQDADSELTRAVQRFWETEAIGIKEKSNPGESNIVRNIHFLDGEGRYEVGLPWKDEILPNSTGYNMCVKRLRQLQSRLKKDRNLFQDYDQIIRDQEKTGIVEQTNCNENSGHFLPHQGVIRQDKETTKLRIVFDGSAKPSEDDLSINDCLERGPNSVPLLFDIIIRFREYPIGLTADIEKAFHQVQIAPDDREMIKFLWFDDIDKENPEIKHYRFRRLTFGLKPSPAILSGMVDHHMSLHTQSHPDIVSLLIRSLYVDDLAGGAFTYSQALEIYESTNNLMSGGGFTLRKWNTNSKELRRKIELRKTSTAGSNEVQESGSPVNKDNCDLSVGSSATNQIPTSDEHCGVKILGTNWNVHKDELQCDTADLLSYAKSLPTTKRSVLKLSAKIFDPLGLLSPFTINMKVLFQILCSKGIDWDDLLDGEILKQWMEILNDLGSLTEAKVPRCYFQFIEETRHHEIHGFSDASEKAYAAVVYLRTKYANGHVDVTLVAAKTRVAPLNKQSIPRLELLGALTLARLVMSILHGLKVT